VAVGLLDGEYMMTDVVYTDISHIPYKVIEAELGIKNAGNLKVGISKKHQPKLQKLVAEYRAKAVVVEPEIKASVNAVKEDGVSADDYCTLPYEMLSVKRWLVWKSVPNVDPSKKPRKVPYYANGIARNGELDTPKDMASLSSFNDALLALQTGEYTGIGFALGADGTGNFWQGVDLDEMSKHPELTYVLDDLPGYTEQTPSGDGWHAIGYGRPFNPLGSNKTGVEAYSSGRFFTVTGELSGINSPCCLADFVEQRLKPLHSKSLSTSAHNDNNDPEPFEKVSAQTVRDLRSALLFMRSDDRERWQRNGHRLKTLGEVGRGLFMEWSSTSEAFDPLADAKTWESFKPTHTNYKAVFKEAQEMGWVNPASGSEYISDDWGFVGSVGVDSGVFDWEKPNDIETNFPPVQALQPELIPEPLRNWLSDISYRMQTPGDFAAISSIVIVGSLIGSGCGIRPKALDDWEVIPNVWGACIGSPSVVLKSPSMKEPMGLLERLQSEYGEQFERDKAGTEFDSLANKAMLDDIKIQLSKAAKGKGKDGVVNGDDLQKIKADYLELTDNAEPEATRRLFKTNETSIQSQTVLQVQNPRGLLTFRDELTALLVKWDREDGADERAYFLEGWNGNGSYTDFKIGRGLTEASNICISMLGGIQPDKLKRYLYQAQNGCNDGLMQRLQLAVWPDTPKNWKLIDTVPNKVEKQRAYAIMQVMAELDFIQYGAIQTEYDDRPYFRFDPEAQEVFNQWLIELQTVKIKHEENPLMVEHFGKFRSLMPSLALIFHCIDIADGKASGSVSIKAAQLAVEWCVYLESHARRIYAMAESPEHEAAARLADKIKTGSVPNPFTTRDIERKGWHGLKDKQEVEAACNILMDEYWLRITRKPKPATGRPPLPEYYINPVFL